MPIRSALRPLVLVALGASLYACGGSDAPKATDPGGSGGGSAAGECFPTAAGCGIPGSKCMAYNDVASSSVKTLRMAQLKLTKPSQLASKTIAFTIIGPAVTIAEKPECYLKTNGKGGQFSWLLEFDLDKKTLKTGGAPPVADPDKGYCYVDTTIAGTPVGPLVVSINYDAAAQTFETIYDDAHKNITVPIFLDPKGEKTPILLPLKAKKDVPMFKGKFSEGGNCIGAFRGDTLKKSDECQTTDDDPKSDESYQFKNDGQLEGYITAEEADNVLIVDLGQSLCSFLSSSKGAKCAADGKSDCCPRDANNKLDYDKFSGKPDYDADGDGANEAWVLGAQIAASAVKINPSCN